MSVVSDSFATPWTVACQAPLSMRFPRQECWSGLPFPSPGESSQTRDWTHVSCIARRFLTAVQLGKPELCYACKLSHIWLLETPWTIGHQGPLSMGFPRQEYWSELPCPLPGDLSDPGIEPRSLATPALAGRFIHHWAMWEAHEWYYIGIQCQSFACGYSVFPEERNGNPFQYSYLENSMDKEACRAAVHGVAKSWTRLSNQHQHIQFSQHRLMMWLSFLVEYSWPPLRDIFPPAVLGIAPKWLLLMLHSGPFSPS